MPVGGNTDNRENRKQVQRKIMDDGRCVFCSPHGGENEGHNDKRRHGHWTVNRGKRKSDPQHYKGARFIPTKRKEVK